MEHRVSAHLPASLLTWGRVAVLDRCIPAAGDPCSLEVAVALAKEIPAGLKIEVWTHFVSDIGRPQIDTPGAPDYVSCQGDAPLERLVYPEAKVHGPGTFFPYRRYAGITLPDGAAPGSRFLFRFENVAMQTFEESLFNLRFAMIRDDEVVGYLGDAFYEVVGSHKQFLRLIVPTCVEVGEPFSCQIVTCDRYGNKSGDPLVGLVFDLELEAEAGDLSFERVAYDADRRLHTVTGVRLEREGTFYIHAALYGAPDVSGRSNPIVARQTWEERIYWGEPHQHTYMADGRGTPTANYAYAISTSCLDFCAVTPHQEFTFAPGMLKIPSPVQKGWEELVEAAEAYNGPDLVTILGSEVSSLGRLSGHMNAYYMDMDNRPELERLHSEAELPYGEHRLASYEEYLNVLERSNDEYLLLPHAHACGGPGRFDLPLRPAYQTNVEICSVHGVFEEFYARWLEHGHLVGVHGGGDNHMTSTGNGIPGWHYPNTNGLTGAYAPARTRQGIWDAFRERKTYAVTGNQRIYLGFSIDGHAMGSVASSDGGPRQVHVEVAGTAPVMKVELLRNGQVIHTYRPPLAGRRHLRLAWTDNWCSRRVDDSQTTGRFALAGGRLSLVSGLNLFHPTDSFVDEGGKIVFRSNGYSGITRGAIVEVSGDAAETLQFEIEDLHLGKRVLGETFSFSLQDLAAHVDRPLDVESRFVRPCFTRDPQRPEFTLDVEWIDPRWPRVVEVNWQDVRSLPGYYYIRVEQIDGNIAWSSPIWFLDQRTSRIQEEV